MKISFVVYNYQPAGFYPVYIRLTTKEGEILTQTAVTQFDTFEKAKAHALKLTLDVVFDTMIIDNEKDEKNAN